jgi:alkylated DNA repair dioxygenase AlkB
MALRQKGITSFFGGKSKNGEACTALAPAEGKNSRFGACPMCRKNFPMHRLVLHAETCVGSAASVEYKPKINTSLPSSGSSERVDESAVNSITEQSEWKVDDECRRSKPPKTPTAAAKRTAPVKMPWWKEAQHHRSNSKRRKRIDNPILPTSEPLPGLFLFEDFITPEEEETILAQLDCKSEHHRQEFLPWKFARFNGDHLGKRWGVHCNLRDRRVSAPENPLPHFIEKILQPKLDRIECMVGCVPNEANAIDYRRKQGHYLQSHVDDRQLSKEPISNLSIAGDCYMTFRNEKKNSGSNIQPDVKRVLLKARTLQVLTGRARYDYSHGIRNEDLLSDRRVSITMRESPLSKKT